MYKSWPVVLFEETIVLISDMYPYILCNFYISLTNMIRCKIRCKIRFQMIKIDSRHVQSG